MATNDYAFVFDYIRRHTPTGAPGRGTGYRDAIDYMQNKMTRYPGSELQVALALAACGLDPDPASATATVLNQPANAAQAAVAAAVLATSIISAPAPNQLDALYARLTRGGPNLARARNELRNVLTYGDVRRVWGHPNLILKNFTSTGLHRRAYMRMAVEAYKGARGLLNRAGWRYLSRSSLLVHPHVNKCFSRYFGDASEKIHVSRLPISARLTQVGPVMSRSELVQFMLRRIYRRAFRKDQIRLYFGGKQSKISPVYAPDNTTLVGLDISVAYNNHHPAIGEPTKIHVGSFFFSLPLTLRAGHIVHEMSHAWVGTQDYVYGDAQCASLAGSGSLQALANADNYAWFLIRAFT